MSLFVTKKTELTGELVSILNGINRLPKGKADAEEKISEAYALLVKALEIEKA